MIKVLFRDSSEVDGVQSRGAGWHQREARGRSFQAQADAASKELVEGDLLTLRDRVGFPVWYLKKGSSTVRLPGCDNLDSLHLNVALRTTSADALAGRVHGDWGEFWRLAPRASWLLHLAARLGLDHRRVTAGACDGVETVLRQLPAGEVHPARAMRAARRWISEGEAHSASSPAVRVASQAAHRAAQRTTLATVHVIADAAYQATYGTSYTMAGAVESVSTLADRGEDADRSLVFLVRLRLPLWRVLLALSSLVSPRP